MNVASKEFIGATVDKDLVERIKAFKKAHSFLSKSMLINHAIRFGIDKAEERLIKELKG